MFSYALKNFIFFRLWSLPFWPVSRNYWEEPASTFFIPLPQAFMDGKGPPEPSLPQAAVPALWVSLHMSESSCVSMDMPVSRRKRTPDPLELGQHSSSTEMKRTMGWTWNQTYDKLLGILNFDLHAGKIFNIAKAIWMRNSNLQAWRAKREFAQTQTGWKIFWAKNPTDFIYVSGLFQDKNELELLRESLSSVILLGFD